MSVSQSAPILSIGDLRSYRRDLRESSQTIVLTNGCFDLLHEGHIAFLSHCASLGDRLIVGLNSDQSVRHLKGPKRPTLNESARSMIIAAIRWVDAVTIFHEPTADELIRAVLPDIYAKGEDYDPHKGRHHLPELSTVTEVGARLEFIPLAGTNSTTTLRSKLCTKIEDDD